MLYDELIEIAFVIDIQNFANDLVLLVDAIPAVGSNMTNLLLLIWAYGRT